MDKKILKYDGRPISADEIVATVRGEKREARSEKREAREFV
jgi:hypothetical protein